MDHRRERLVRPALDNFESDYGLMCIVALFKENI